MKCAAAEDDIVKLFGIMLGRRPSPASYISENRGRPVRELARRMASSREFRTNVIEPILQGDSAGPNDRALRSDEKRWLKTSAQLPSAYDGIIQDAPTRLSTALALGHKAMEEMGSGQSKDRTMLDSALRKIGRIPESPQADRSSRKPLTRTRRLSKKERITSEDHRFIWAMLGGTESELPKQCSAQTGFADLAVGIRDLGLLTDRLIPFLHSNDEEPGLPWHQLPSSERRDWIDCHLGGQMTEFIDLDDVATLLARLTLRSDLQISALFEEASSTSFDCADAVAEIESTTRLHNRIMDLWLEEELGAAVGLCRRALSQDLDHIRLLARAIEADLLKKSEPQDRVLLDFLFDTSSGFDLKAEEAKSALELEAGAAPTRIDEDRLFYLIDRGYSLPDLVRSAARVALEPGQIVTLRSTRTAHTGSASALSFNSEINGIICRGSAKISEVSRLWLDKEHPATGRFLPVSPLPRSAVPAPAVDAVVVSTRPLAEQNNVASMCVAGSLSLSQALETSEFPDETPVLLLCSEIEYSPDYVAYAVAQYTKFGKPPIVPLLPLEITAADNKISIANEPHHHARLCPLAWLPMSVQSMRATRSNKKPVHALLSDLIGTRDLSHPQDQGHGAGAVYGVLPDPHTLTSNKDRFKSLFTYWEGELESQRPALSAQLPSFEAVRSDAIGQQIARRTIARPIIQRIDEIFSEIDSVARGAAGPDALAAIANTKTTDLLLGLGQHHRVRAELPRLAGSCAFAAETSPDVVRWALDLARGAGAQHETAESLRACVSKILRREPELVRPVFDFLAGCLSPDALLAHLNRCIAEFGSELTTKQRRRFADVIRLYGDYHSASEFLEQLRVAEKGEKADDRPIRNRISSALLRGRPLGGSVRTTQESERHKASLPNEERLRHALADLDHQGFQSAFRARYAEKECLLSVLDPLRSSALDIAGFAFRPDEIPYHFCRDGEETAIMAQIFGDLSTLGEAFDQPIGHLSALIGSCLGDDTPLISILSDLSSVTGSIIPQPDGSDSNRLFDAYLDIKAPDTTAQHGMVSVIMSTLDTEPALMTRSIRSLLQQSYQDFEIIVIDDGSAPHLAAEVRRLEELDQRIRCFAMPRNLGPYLCRNFALSLTRGSFVAIQDADDVSHPQRLEHQVAVMSKNSDVQLVTSDHLRIDPRGWPQFEHGFKLFGDGTMSSLFRREVFHRLGPFLKVRSRGDVEFRERIRRCLGAKCIQHIGFPLLLCHASAQTLSQRTVSSKGAYLQLFRGQIDAIRPHRDLIERGCMPDIAIPVPLQG